MFDLFVGLLLVTAINGLDDLFVDVYFLATKIHAWLRRDGVKRPTPPPQQRPSFAILIPAWREEDVLPDMLTHLRANIQGDNYHVYVGVYANDPATYKAALSARTYADMDWLHVVAIDRDGPTTKADCLNRLWRYLCQDDRPLPDAIAFHDAEDVVEPAELSLFARALTNAGMVQLPVIPLVPLHHRWVGGHYLDEFARMHGLEMAVRERITGMTPCAGTGFAVQTRILQMLDQGSGPFDPTHLTEDYALSHAINRLGYRTVFVPSYATTVKGDGQRRMMGIREHFPEIFAHAIRQKARWCLGIVFQSTLRLGWPTSLRQAYGFWRDRKGPLVIMIHWLSLLLMLCFLAGALAGPKTIGGGLWLLFGWNLGLMIYRLSMRFALTARWYGPVQGLMALPRVLFSNIINLMAFLHALVAFHRHRRDGNALAWQKTSHTFPTQPS